VLADAPYRQIQPGRLPFAISARTWRSAENDMDAILGENSFDD
jgi:hypothetical protein